MIFIVTVAVTKFSFKQILIMSFLNSRIHFVPIYKNQNSLLQKLSNLNTGSYSLNMSKTIIKEFKYFAHIFPKTFALLLKYTQKKVFRA